MRETFHWAVPVGELLSLMMDNASKHGTSDAKTQYADALKECNIEIIWQILHSPETNMLDPGVWMSVQMTVMETHHMW